MSTKTFTYEGGRYKLEVVLTLDTDGKVTASVTAVEGSVDFNGFYWGADTGSFLDFRGKDSSPNMNGEGSQFEGEAVLWDDARKTTNPGLVKIGEDKFSFIQEGDSYTFDLMKMSPLEFENLEHLGIGVGGNNPFEGPDVWSHGAPHGFGFFFYDDDAGKDPLPVGYKTDENGNIVAIGDNKYGDGYNIGFDPTWAPEESDSIA